MDLGILGGTLVTPAAVFLGHLYVAGGRIAAISSEQMDARRTVEADGLYVLPGIVDSHVHFMDPGAVEREDFITGSSAAAVGGTTTVIEHTHAHPVVDAEALRAKADHLMLDAVNRGHLTLQRLAEVMAETPARLYGLYPAKGALRIGADADLALVDLTRERVLRDEEVVSRAGWTPYAGRPVRGQAVMTFVRGRLVAEEGKPVGEPGWGRFVSRPGAGIAV